MGATSKILKALGKTARGLINDAEVYSQAAENATLKLAPKVKNMFKEVDYEGKEIEDKIFNPFGYELKNRYALAIGGTALAFGAVDGALRVNNESHLDRMSAGGLQYQINETHSPAIYSDRALGKYQNKYQHQVSTHGAEGDIVFALHNMR